jgi:hypothetical protein
MYGIAKFNHPTFQVVYRCFRRTAHQKVSSSQSSTGTCVTTCFHLDDLDLPLISHLGFLMEVAVVIVEHCPRLRELLASYTYQQSIRDARNELLHPTIAINVSYPER